MHTTGNKFSAMVHQHNNAYVKCSDNQGALRRRMITGPELAKIHLEVEEQTTKQHDGAYDTGHQHRTCDNVGRDGKSISRTQAMLTEYCHNYAETARMIMTIVGFSLHHYMFVTEIVEKCTTPITHKHFKISICHCSESYRMRLIQLRRHSLHQRTVTVFPFRACTSPVKHEMETSIISSPMQTIQPRRLCQPEGKCGLGLRQIYFVAWIQICTKPIVFMLLTQ